MERTDREARILLTFLCCAVFLLQGCTATLSQSRDADRRSSSSTSLREGPVTIETDVLLDPAAQRARFGRTVEPELFTRVVPLHIIVENHETSAVGSRTSADAS